MNVSYHTFGCKTNQYDTERLRREIEGCGGRTVVGPRDADVVVVNTCTVTSQADAQARRYIRRVRRENPGIRVVAVGCSAAFRPESYREMAEVSAVVSGHDPQAVAAAVDVPSTALVRLTMGRAASSSGRRAPSTEPTPAPMHGRARGWLKIQDGCDRTCSFCATRLARGRSRSCLPEDIEREAVSLADSHAELVLTGVHIGHYGRDLDPRVSLSDLVGRLIGAVPGVRFRLGSIEATEIDDALVEMLEGSGGRLAPHLHMPLQSGADPVLRRMRRWYRGADYRARTERIAARLPILGLGADIITGFPGETQSDHRETVRMVEDLPFTYLHVFPFSPRRGTAAESIHARSPVAERVAGERGRELRDLANRKTERYERRRTGERAVVAPENGGWGTTEDYLRVRMPAEEGARIGRLGMGGDRLLDLVAGTLRRDGDGLAIDLTHRTPFI